VRRLTFGVFTFGVSPFADPLGAFESFSPLGLSLFPAHENETKGAGGEVGGSVEVFPYTHHHIFDIVCTYINTVGDAKFFCAKKRVCISSFLVRLCV